MLDRFLAFIKQERLLTSESKVLLALSGGMDSMAMAHLFRAVGMDIGIAHCNFRLRGEASDADESFVQNYAQQYDIPFFSKSFDTLAFAEKHQLSTQMAARKLRYQWFQQVLNEEKYDRLAVAHHMNDVVETMLINQLRGTGIRGMHGILSRKGNIIRPMLCFTRDEIAEYVTENRLQFREDSSNASTKYMRNKIRHQIVPVLKELNPSLEKTFRANAQHFADVELVLNDYVEKHRHLLKEEKDFFTLDFNQLLAAKAPNILLFEMLKPFDFHTDIIADIISAQSSQPGKQFASTSHIAVKDRDLLFIYPIQQRPEPVFEKLFKREDNTYDHDFRIPQSPFIACLDAEKLGTDISVRYWQDGDDFTPLGMKGRKKLSDFFVDEKVPLYLKHRIPLLISDGEIVWVVGYRISDKVKISPSTKKIAILELKKQTDG